MAFDPTKLRLVEADLNAEFQEWAYDTTDAVNTVAGSGYFTNVKRLGVRVGDKISIRVFDALPAKGSLTALAYRGVSAVNATTGNATADIGLT